MPDIYWLSYSDISNIHGRSLQGFGGLDGIRDTGLLESALARPHNLHAYDGVTDIHQLAASYAESIAQNHPYFDGNKRVGFFCAYAFLAANGYLLNPEKDRNHTDKMEALAQSKISRNEMARHLKNQSQKI